MSCWDDYRDHLQREYDFAQIRLCELASTVQGIGERTHLSASTGANVSDSGELQSTASRFDIACATYTQCRRMLADFDRYYDAIAGRPRNDAVELVARIISPGEHWEVEADKPDDYDKQKARDLAGRILAALVENES